MAPAPRRRRDGATPQGAPAVNRRPGVSAGMLALVGRTPCVELQRLVPGNGCRILVKLESANPGLSVKDRAALQIIIEAERSGRLQGGGTVIERTSGNMGTGLALVCRQRGYRLIVVMSAGNSVERRQMIGAFGARVVVVPQVTGTPGQVTGADLKRVEEETEALAARIGAFRADQFRNEASVRAHERGTGPELWRQAGGRVDVFVSVVGSSGTFTGVARFLKRRRPEIRCLVVEPRNAALLAGRCRIPGKHKLQGLGYLEVPPLFDRSLADGFMTVTDTVAMRTARRLARDEGILAGFTSGANVAAALAVARRTTRPLTIATVICDNGLKYLSTGLFPDPA